MIWGEESAGGYTVIWGEGVCGWLHSDMGGGGVCGWLRSDMGGGSLRLVTQ